MDGEGKQGLGSLGEFLPTFVVLVLLTTCWGGIQYADGAPWIALAIGPPLAIGMLSAAAVRMLLGRSFGDVITVTLAGVFVFLGMTALATLVSWVLYSADNGDGLPLEAAHLVLSVGVGMIGASIGSFALGHYAAGSGDSEDPEGSEWGSQMALKQIDYSTEPSRLLCLITNQEVRPKEDNYVVCHNPMNVSSTCHAVYLMEHVPVLKGRCNRCYKPFLQRDLRGMRRRRKA